PRADQRGDVRASVPSHGGQLVELCCPKGVANLLPADRFGCFTESRVELADRHTHTDRVTAPNSSRNGIPADKVRGNVKGLVQRLGGLANQGG
ncbi:MAG: hypothetical protein WAL30_00150, partial [Candidatus Aquirickettsiella sp.]